VGYLIQNLHRDVRVVHFAALLVFPRRRIGMRVKMEVMYLGMKHARGGAQVVHHNRVVTERTCGETVAPRGHEESIVRWVLQVKIVPPHPPQVAPTRN
jgi:hypothetical protein